MRGMIIIDDKRYEHTKKFLEDKGHIFCENMPCPRNLDFAVFPFAAGIDEDVYNDGFFAAINKSAVIFSGIKNEYVAQKCAHHGLAYHIMMDDKEIAKKNAVPTSEGVIAYLVTSRQSTIAGARMLVIGYGICGSDLAGRLKVLDAEVYTLVRNGEKEELARKNGIIPIYLHGLFAHGFDAIINTVPSPVLTDEMIEKLGGVLLIDIASKPYGINMAAARRLNEKSTLLPAIPGKYAVKTSGEVLGQYIENIIGGNKNDI